MTMTRDQYRVAKQKTRKVYSKIQILNQERRILDEIQGIVKGGDYEIRAQVGIRRSCNLEVLVDKSWLPAPNSRIWLDKLFRLYIGIEDNRTGDIVWYLIGTMVMGNVKFTVSSTGSYILDIEGYDMVCLLNGDFGGSIGAYLKIENDRLVSDAITSVMQTRAKESNLQIETTDFLVPYTLEYGPRDNIWDIIETLVELYLDYEAFYDAWGNFVFQRASNLYRDSTFVDLGDFDLVSNPTFRYNFDNVRNSIICYGRQRKEGRAQPVYKLQVTDQNFPDSPYTIEKLGEKTPRQITIEEDHYIEVEHCRMRCDYELNLRNNMAVQLTLDTIPMYFLDVNKIVDLSSERFGIEGRYCINGISCDLSYSGTMRLDCHEVYQPKYHSEAKGLHEIGVYE